MNEGGPHTQQIGSRMQAYDATWVHDLHILKTAKKLLKQKQITSDQHDNARSQFSSPYALTNPRIRNAAYIFTALSFMCGFAWLFYKANGPWIIPVSGTILIITDVAVRGKNWYRNGIDSALLHGAIFWLIFGLVVQFKLLSSVAI